MNHHLHHQLEERNEKNNEKREVKGKEKNSNEIVKSYICCTAYAMNEKNTNKFEKEKKFL